MSSSFETSSTYSSISADPPAAAPSAWRAAPETLDLAIIAEELSGEVLNAASEVQLLLLLPLILQRVTKCHVARRPSPLVESLRQRLCASRRLKLRFLLLREHPAFEGLLCTLRYSRRAYVGVPVVSTACSSSKLDLFEASAPRALLLPVDMVGKRHSPLCLSLHTACHDCTCATFCEGP